MDPGLQALDWIRVYPWAQTQRASIPRISLCSLHYARSIRSPINGSLILWVQVVGFDCDKLPGTAAVESLWRLFISCYLDERSQK